MIIIVTGAGISQSSGLQTFEELENKGIDMRKVLDRKYANNNWEKFSKEYIEFATKINEAEPNNNHKIIDKLQKIYGKEQIIVGTMNVDSLHEKAETEAYELHGNCKHCNPEIDSIVLYGDALPKQYFDFIDKISDARYENIFFLVIGSSMQTSTIQMIEEEVRMLKFFGNCEVSQCVIREDLIEEDFFMMCKRYLKEKINEDNN